MDEDLKHLFSPVVINSMELPNRAVMPAMGTGYGAMDGTVSDRLVAYLERRAMGGAGLIITEVCAIDPRGKGFMTEIGAWSDQQVGGLSRIPEALHRHGAAAALQLHHAGRETLAAFAGATPEAPSAIPSAILMQPCEEMSQERIGEVIAAYGSAARRAKEAGFDAVEVHGAHGYLIGQFLSPFSNARTDEYGGSDEARSLFVLQVLGAVRHEVGPDFPIIVRISVDERIKGGYGLDFTTWLAPALVEAGADAIHASIGVYSTPGNLTIPTSDTPAGFNLSGARAIKEAVGVPVIGVGRITDPRMATDAIGRGDADMISFGRQHLADPDFLDKARRGAFEDIRWCLSCNQGCIERMSFEMKPTSCTINPECGKEERDYERTGHPLRVKVIGAGPAGLSAAIAALRCGHEVDVYERAPVPGGQMDPASRPPGKSRLADWVDWAERQVRSRGGQIHQGTEVTPAMITGWDADAIILAAGAAPCAPPVQGLENALDARDVLIGKVKAQGRVAMLGAGYVGMETADLLVSRGCDVTVIEMLEVPPVGKERTHGYWLHRRLVKSGGRLITGARVTRVDPGTVSYEKAGSAEQLSGVDAVVVAMGASPRDELRPALEACGSPFRVVGDACLPRRLFEAIHEGDTAGRQPIPTP